MNVNFDVLTLLTALVLYSQSDYLNDSNRDSDWLKKEEESGKKHSTTSRVSPYTSFALYPLPACTVKASLFVKSKSLKIVYHLITSL